MSMFSGCIAADMASYVPTSVSHIFLSLQSLNQINIVLFFRGLYPVQAPCYIGK